MDMPKQLVTLADLNRRSRKFWVKQSELLSTRIQNEALYKIAMQDLSAEQAMGMPPKYLKSLEQALARADELRTICLRAFARNGGKAAKTDALQRLIVDIVRAEPNITIRALEYKMRKMVRGGDSTITQMDPKAGASSDRNPQIHFDDDGEPKSAPFSGLKDRLYRAKQKNTVALTASRDSWPTSLAPERRNVREERDDQP